MELHVSKEAVNLESGNFVNMAEGKKAAKKRTKNNERTNRNRLEFTLVDQTVRRFVRPDIRDLTQLGRERQRRRLLNLCFPFSLFLFV